MDASRNQFSFLKYSMERNEVLNALVIGPFVILHWIFFNGACQMRYPELYSILWSFA